MYSPSGDQSPGYEAAPDYEDLQNNLDTVMLSAAKHLLHYQQRAQSVREILRHKKRASE